LLVAGKSNREIAEAMGLSENTVKVHLAAIFRVLGVSSRTEALLAGLKRMPPA
jgi:DNA-binding NarL/FixJ family response regulator